ncbi:unnamed protein product [Auanema sp. JU1783]|nr:unnamed protein product [Auanema sp. JU1783]
MEKYQEEGRIGQGAYGVVIKARAKQSGQVVAVKKMSLSRDRLIIVREICSLRNLCHPNILRLIDCFCSTDTISIVTEFVSFHLNDIFTDPRRPKDEQFARYFYAQILTGVAHIHSLNVMHRDLKPENILVTSLLVVKIADFGQACLYFPNEPHREYEENVATRWYRAPELLFGSRHYGPAVDVWALGCILTEFFNSTPLIQGRTDIEQISKIFSLLGTPTEQTWPSWSALPDSSKLVFEEQQPPQTLSSLVDVKSHHRISFEKPISVTSKG